MSSSSSSTYTAATSSTLLSTSSIPSLWHELRTSVRTLMQDKVYRSHLIYAHALAFFALLELVASSWADSTVLLCDAFVLLYFATSIYLNVSALQLTKKAGEVYTFGYERFEIMGQFAGFWLLFFVFISSLKDVLTRIAYPIDVDPDVMFLFGSLSLVFVLVGTRIRGHCRLHFGDLNTNIYAMSWIRCALSQYQDLMTPVCSLTASYFSSFDYDAFHDSMFGLGGLLCVLIDLFPKMRANLRILVQTPLRDNIREINSKLSEVLQIQGVLSLFSSKFWALSEHKLVASIIVRISHHIDEMKVLNEIQNMLSPFVHDLTVQIEKEGFSLSGSQESQYEQDSPPESSCSSVISNPSMANPIPKIASSNRTDSEFGISLHPESPSPNRWSSSEMSSHIFNSTESSIRRPLQSRNISGVPFSRSTMDSSMKS